MTCEAVSPTEEQRPTAGDCRAQLERILSSPDFGATDRKLRFLSYVVDEALAGRGDRIKAYSIAVEVFGRDASFDPQADPIVRVEAGHLRRALERYYLTAGRQDPVLISIPKGGYVPTFSLRGVSSFGQDEPAAVPAHAQPPRRLWPWLMAAGAILVAAALALGWRYASPGAPHKAEVPRLLVEWFAPQSGPGESAALARGFTEELISQLSKFKDIVVVQPLDKASLSNVRYVLTGSVDLSADTYRFHMRLLNRADGSVLWAQNYEGATTVSDLLRTQADIASKVATSLAQADGVIFEADAGRIVPHPPDDWAAYTCTLSYYSYRATFDSQVRPSVRSCLEKAVERFPDYATGWALLSLTYIDEARFRFPFDPVRSPQLIDRALSAANRAVKLEPVNVRGLQAQMLALYLKGEVDAAMRVGSRAMSLNPNDTVLVGEYGDRLALSGNWDKGCPLLETAHARNLRPAAYYEVGLAMCAYFRGDYEQAAEWIRKANVQTNALYHVIAAAIFAEAGDGADVERERRWLLEHEPALVANLRQETLLRLSRPEDAERFLSSLRKAGLKFRDSSPLGGPSNPPDVALEKAGFGLHP